MDGLIVYAILNKRLKAAEEVTKSFPGGFLFKGEVDYVSNLPQNAAIGDLYVVRYIGEPPSTTIDREEYAWGMSGGTAKWINVTKDYGGKVELTYDGEHILYGDAPINFAQLVELLQVRKEFTYLLYDKYAYLTTIIETDTTGMRYVHMESTTIDGGFAKHGVIEIDSGDGVEISAIVVKRVVSENANNKVSEITPRLTVSDNLYPSVKALHNYVGSTIVVEDSPTEITLEKNFFYEFAAVAESMTVHIGNGTGCYGFGFTTGAIAPTFSIKFVGTDTSVKLFSVEDGAYVDSLSLDPNTAYEFNILNGVAVWLSMPVS